MSVCGYTDILSFYRVIPGKFQGDSELLLSHGESAVKVCECRLAGGIRF